MPLAGQLRVMMDTKNYCRLRNHHSNSIYSDFTKTFPTCSIQSSSQQTKPHPPSSTIPKCAPPTFTPSTKHPVTPSSKRATHCSSPHPTKNMHQGSHPGCLVPSSELTSAPQLSFLLACKHGKPTTTPWPSTGRRRLHFTSPRSFTARRSKRVASVLQEALELGLPLIQREDLLL